MKVFISLTIITLYSTISIAQNRSIEFIDNDFEKAKSEAKAQGKLIFVDAFATWCGPCKWMAANKFTNDTIADFYNSNFVSLKMDMEKGEGIEMAKTYKVRAYPTLLFLDSDGNMVHRTVGASQETRDYIDKGLVALNPFERLSTFDQVWNEGVRTPEFVKSYLDKLNNAGINSEDVMNAYYVNLNEDQLMDQGTWTIISKYDKTIDSKGMVNLLEKRDAYIALYGQDKVEKVLYQNYLAHLYSIVYAKDFKMKNMELAMIDIKKKQIPYWQKIDLLGDLAHLKKVKKYKDYCEVITEDAGDYFNEDANTLNTFAWNVFQWSDKKEQLEVALGWAERSLELKESAATQDTYSNLLFKLGRINEAIKSQERAIELVKNEGGDASEYEETLESFKK